MRVACQPVTGNVEVVAPAAASTVAPPVVVRSTPTAPSAVVTPSSSGSGVLWPVIVPADLWAETVRPSSDAPAAPARCELRVAAPDG